MKTLLLTLTVSMAMTSCSSGLFKSKKHERSLANTGSYARFITQLAEQTKKSPEAIEKSIISFIQRQDSNMTHGNHVVLGLSEDQAKKITSLSDDLPYMSKVQKWAMENITTVDKTIDAKVVAKVYENVLEGPNPYVFKAKGTSQTRRRSRQGVSPFKSIAKKQERVLASIEELSDPKLKEHYKQTFAEISKRGADSPEVLANGQEIIESAVRISQKTGVKALGDGCPVYNQTAPSEVLEIQANLDLYTARQIDEMDLSGLSEKEISEIIDNARVNSFRDKLGYTPDEARAALSRLKQEPCKVY